MTGVNIGADGPDGGQSRHETRLISTLDSDHTCSCGPTSILAITAHILLQNKMNVTLRLMTMDSYFQLCGMHTAMLHNPQPLYCDLG